MAFKQGKSPVLVIRGAAVHKMFRGALLASGYRFHDGPRTTREREVQAWVANIGRGRQVHVQEERRRDGSVAIFAHTEPEGHGLRHLVAAVLDQTSFSGGARALLADLRARGWDV